MESVFLRLEIICNLVAWNSLPCYMIVNLGWNYLVIFFTVWGPMPAVCWYFKWGIGHHGFIHMSLLLLSGVIGLDYMSLITKNTIVVIHHMFTWLSTFLSLQLLFNAFFFTVYLCGSWQFSEQLEGKHSSNRKTFSVLTLCHISSLYVIIPFSNERYITNSVLMGRDIGSLMDKMI